MISKNLKNFPSSSSPHLEAALGQTFYPLRQIA